MPVETPVSTDSCDAAGSLASADVHSERGVLCGGKFEHAGDLSVYGRRGSVGRTVRGRKPRASYMDVLAACPAHRTPLPGHPQPRRCSNIRTPSPYTHNHGDVPKSRTPGAFQSSLQWFTIEPHGVASMTSPRPFRFGIQLSSLPVEGWVERVRGESKRWDSRHSSFPIISPHPRGTQRLSWGARRVSRARSTSARWCTAWTSVTRSSMRGRPQRCRRCHADGTSSASVRDGCRTTTMDGDPARPAGRAHRSARGGADDRHVDVDEAERRR